MTSNNLLSNECTCISCDIVIQYRSKVSYHLSPRFSRDESLVSRDESLVSRDESLVSREPLKRIFWNKLPAVSLRESD